MAGFKKATKSQAKLRLGLCGPSGAGKTYSALCIAAGLGGKVAVIDTEHGSASKYADEFEFDVLELDSFHPQNYINGIRDAEQAGYDALVIDSLTHAWSGKDGVLELHDKAVKRQKTQNSYTAWGDVTPLHQQLIEAMLQSRLHLIATMRSKVEYVQEKGSDGKTQIRKVGMAPVQRDGMEYEFDIVGDLDVDHNLVITKSRCKAVADAVVNKPGANFAATIKAWLTDGEPAPERPPQHPHPEPPQQHAPQPQAPASNVVPIADDSKALPAYFAGIGDKLSNDEAKQLLRYAWANSDKNEGGALVESTKDVPAFFVRQMAAKASSCESDALTQALDTMVTAYELKQMGNAPQSELATAGAQA